MVNVFLQMTTEMDTEMKNCESLALEATLRIPLPHLRRPRGVRLLGPQPHFASLEGQAEPDWTGSSGMPTEAADERVLWMEKFLPEM